MEKKDAAVIDILNSPSAEKLQAHELDAHKTDEEKAPAKINTLNVGDVDHHLHRDKVQGDVNVRTNESAEKKLENQEEAHRNLEDFLGEAEAEPIFDGTESQVSYSWPEKAITLKNFVKDKSAVAVSNVIQRLSGKRDEEGENVTTDQGSNKDVGSSTEESEAKEIQRTVEQSVWNPLNYIKIFKDVYPEGKVEQRRVIIEEPVQSVVATNGRIILYTRLGCQQCKEARLFLHQKRLRYVEINIDVFPSRKLELEKITGSSSVPKVLFNEVLIGGLDELKRMNESGTLNEKIDYVITEGPSDEAPLPPLSGEDDVSSSGTIDDLAILVKRMRESIVVKDHFYKMRRFTNCFLGSDAVDFLSEDQYLEREEAIEFGQKLASKLFFQHVLDENLFEDGNHLYRFLDHDPIVMSQCHNIPRGIVEVIPKPITEIASRLRFLSYAIFEAYTSENGKHVDYKSIHESEEFARYLRIIEELQRVELEDMPKEEKLAFFINLYNMMAIHAILTWGHPARALERRKLLGDFKYVVGGSTYSLSAIQNGILRANQRPPYNLIKPFGARDRRSQVALPYPEPLIHFALVCGTRSGPALRCFSPGNIDRELMDAARSFLRTGGLMVDSEAKVASVSKILKWFSVDFGKNEVEVLKHAANYLEQATLEAVLELLGNSQLKVIYQPYDWGLNC